MEIINLLSLVIFFYQLTFYYYFIHIMHRGDNAIVEEEFFIIGGGGAGNRHLDDGCRLFSFNQERCRLFPVKENFRRRISATGPASRREKRSESSDLEFPTAFAT